MKPQKASNGCTPIDGPALQSLLNRLGLTHDELRKSIGIDHKKSIENWCRGRSQPRFENAKELGQALLIHGATTSELSNIGLPALSTHSVGALVTQEQIETTLSCIDKMVRTVPILDRYLDVESHLRHLRQELQVLEDVGDPEGVSTLLKGQIKNLCIVAEEFFTDRFSGDSKTGRFLYACSSLLDTGIQSYVADPGWMMLLRRMGRVAKRPNTTVTRIFFLRKATLLENELNQLSKVIEAHLAQNVSIGIVDQDLLPADMMLKRNMACIDGRVLLHATDQVQWDLDFTEDSRSIQDAASKHDGFLDRLMMHYGPADVTDVSNSLKHLFNPTPNPNS
jgi:hypothetical protein